MTKLLAVLGLTAFAYLTLVVAADAQVTEGQSFYATPMSHGGISTTNTQVESNAPPPAPPPVAPPAPAKHKGRKHKHM